MSNRYKNANLRTWLGKTVARVSLLLPVFFMLLQFYFVFDLAYRTTMGPLSETWEKNQAVVTSSSKDRRCTVRNNCADVFLITYRFISKGNQCESNVFTFGNVENDKQVAELLAKYTIGKKFTIYMNPYFECRAVVIPGNIPNSHIYTMIFFLLTGSILFFVIFNARRELFRFIVYG